MAERFAAEGMKVVLADVEAEALSDAERQISSGGAKVLAVKTDVSKADGVEALAKRAYREFGAVHVVCNNAGVSPKGGPSWEHTLDDWRWVLGVNLWGVIHGVHSFVPRMIASGEEGHVVNTASLAGLISGPFLSPYGVTKHAVVTLSESMYHDLKLSGAKVGVSVLCPAWVNTKIWDSDRNRPSDLSATKETLTPWAGADGVVRGLLASGLDPSVVAGKVFDAIREDRFYVLPHPQYKPLVEKRMRDVLEEHNPTFTPMIGVFGQAEAELEAATN
jgi:NAD(P)-dependent dehydrogenase (short-subunit alcohol dehydrogenase family)